MQQYNMMQCTYCISSTMREGALLSWGGDTHFFVSSKLGSYSLSLTQWVTMTITSVIELIFLLPRNVSRYCCKYHSFGCPGDSGQTIGNIYQLNLYIGIGYILQTIEGYLSARPSKLPFPLPCICVFVFLYLCIEHLGI